MSDGKKAGSRDISDLKARLGLKKAGGAASASTGAQPSNGARPGGVVAPPGMAVPPPPGAHAPQPAGPVIPNAADDPFGAMNAMAAVAQVQRPPEKEYIVVDQNVEKVAQNKGALARMAIPAAIALVVGIAVGKIGTSAASYNAGLSDARAILGKKGEGLPSSVSNVKATLAELDTALDEANTKNGLKPNLELDKKLKEISAKLDIKPEQIYRAKQNSLDPVVSGQILSFYAGVQEVKDMIDMHNKSAAFDDIALKGAKDKQDKATQGDDTQNPGMFRYAVLMSAPTDEDKSDFGAKLVEIAGVYCGSSTKEQAKCPEGEYPAGYAYRNEPGGGATRGDLVTNGADNVPTKKVVPLLPNGIRDAFVKGTDATVSEVYYQRRLKALYERVHGKAGNDGKPTGGLLDDGNKLQTRLQTESGKGTRFSFFM